MPRIAVVLAAVVAALALGSSAHAQTPTPTMEPELRPFPYRVVISGPPTVPAGEPVTFTVEYARVSPATDVGSGIALAWGPPQSGITLTKISARSGQPPSGAVPAGGDSERLSLVGDVGTLDVTLQPPLGFTGELTLGFYVPGTGIALPEGTVDRATTQIVAAPSSPATARAEATPVLAPNTGDGASAAHRDRSLVVLIAALAALASVALSGGWMLRRRWK